LMESRKDFDLESSLMEKQIERMNEFSEKLKIEIEENECVRDGEIVLEKEPGVEIHPGDALMINSSGRVEPMVDGCIDGMALCSEDRVEVRGNEVRVRKELGGSQVSYEKIARPKIEYIAMRIDRREISRRGSALDFTAKAFIEAVRRIIVQFKRMTVPDFQGNQIPKYMADLRPRDLVIQIHPQWIQVCMESMYEQFSMDAFRGEAGQGIINEGEPPELRVNHGIDEETIIFNLTESYLMKCGLFNGSEFEGLK